jgi:hypothetical protein
MTRPKTNMIPHRYIAMAASNIGIVFLLHFLPFLAGMGQPPDNIEKQSQSHGNANLKH